MIEEAIKEIDKAVRAGVIERYAIGGAIGAIVYMEPFETRGLDVFTHLPVTDTGLVSLSDIYSYFRERGYRSEGHWLIIKGVRVQFLAPDTPLVAEAIDKAVEVKIGTTSARVFRPEHLLAIMLQVGTRKHLARLEAFLEQADFDRAYFIRLLRDHGLWKKWQAFLRSS